MAPQGGGKRFALLRRIVDHDDTVDPAPLAASTKASVPKVRWDRHSRLNTTGVRVSVRRNSCTICRQRRSPTPLQMPRSAARWITGPSAIGSERHAQLEDVGTGAHQFACKSGTVRSAPASPPAIYVTSPARPRARNCAKQVPMRPRRHRPSRPRSRRPHPRPAMPALAPHILHAPGLGDDMQVLVPATAQVDEQDLVLGQPRRQLRRVGQRNGSIRAPE